MGVQDNPACIGNCIITGVEGTHVLLERLVSEGYEFGADQALRISDAADKLQCIARAIDGDNGEAPAE